MRYVPQPRAGPFRTVPTRIRSSTQVRHAHSGAWHESTSRFEHLVRRGIVARALGHGQQGFAHAEPLEPRDRGDA